MFVCIELAMGMDLVAQIVLVVESALVVEMAFVVEIAFAELAVDTLGTKFLDLALLVSVGPIRLDKHKRLI